LPTSDVIVLGSGIAGAFLARQLKLARPDLRVVVLEAAASLDDYKVGESTVEVAASSMIRRLGLGTYLYQHQLPKNGLRFFFDSPGKDLPLPRMSEIGSDHMPFHPSFQLERASLERDLAVMNRALGIEVEMGAKVTGVRLDPAAGHTVTYEQGGELREVTCRWVCDASGRRHVLSRQLGLPIHKETRLDTAASWGRYRNVAGLDAVVDPAWRARVRYTSRHLSTNHLMYDGYWIWFIPLAGDLMSVGVVFDRSRLPDGPLTRPAFEAFLRTHRAARDLLEGAVPEDFQSYAHLPYSSDHYFSAEGRWALTGFAGAFTDPFYSPGSDFIATANDFITSLVLTDLDGRDDELRARAAAYDDFYRLKVESTLRLYVGLYPVFGSYTVFRLKYLLDFNNYYNLVFWPFLADKLTDLAFLREELRLSDLILKAQSAMAGHFIALAADLAARGEYFAENEGRFANGLAGVGQYEEKLGPVLDPAFRKAELDKAYGGVFASVLEQRTGVRGLAGRKRVMAELSLPAVLALRGSDDAALGRLLQHTAARLGRELKKEMPAVEKVAIERDPESGALRPVVACGGAPEDGERALARASSLWDAGSTPKGEVTT
jgi:flavin-dependent dehydrogenase